MQLPRRRSQSGFTLLEVLLAIGISLTIGAVALTEMRRDNESSQAKAVGQQLAMVGNALNNYIALHHDRIVDLDDRDVSIPGDPAPRFCSTTGMDVDEYPLSICTITTDTLVRGGMLPRNFSGRNAFGAGYDIYIRVIGEAAMAMPIVDGMVVVNQPYTTGGAQPRYDLMGQAMQEAGADSGMTRTTDNLMEGLNGTWSDGHWPAVTHDGVTYPGVDALGLLGYRVGYGSSAYMAFLRLDGTLPMTGPLNMDGEDITNVRGIDVGHAFVEGAITLGTRDDISDPDRTEIAPGVDGGLVIQTGDQGVNIRDHSGDPGGLYAGAIETSGLTSNGNITADGNIEAQDILARNVQLSGFASVAGNITSTADIGAVNITASETVSGARVEAGDYTLDGGGLTRASHPAWFYYVSTDPAIPSGWRTTGNILADGEIQGGSLRLNAVGATVGAPCLADDAGTIQRTGGGDLVQCIEDGAGNRHWRVMGAQTTWADGTVTQVSEGAVATGWATCPAGTTLVGGGHAITTSPCPAVPTGTPGACQGGLDSRSPSSSFPNFVENRWEVWTGQDTAPGTAFHIYAVCAF